MTFIRIPNRLAVTVILIDKIDQKIQEIKNHMSTLMLKPHPKPSDEPTLKKNLY